MAKGDGLIWVASPQKAGYTNLSGNPTQKEDGVYNEEMGDRCLVVQNNAWIYIRQNLRERFVR